MKKVMGVRLGALTGVMMCAIVAPANAATTGFTLLINGNTNVPTMTLTNDSTLAQLIRFTLTIGNTTRNYDSVTNTSPPPGGSFTLNSPDTNSSGGVRSDVIDIAFTGFDPAEQFSWDADFDIDNGNTNENYRTVLFNNGTADNAVATAFFLGGSSVALTLPDGNATATSFTFSASEVSAVPLPAALSLMLLGLGTFGGLRVVSRNRGTPV
jgi:hypothetical protein